MSVSRYVLACRYSGLHGDFAVPCSNLIRNYSSWHARLIEPLLLGLTDLVSEHGLPLGALAADVVVSRTNIFDSYIGKILCVRLGILFTSYPTHAPSGKEV